MMYEIWNGDLFICIAYSTAEAEFYSELGYTVVDFSK